jgi:hypothetical protein
MGHHRGVKPWEITWVLFDAQAACAFSWGQQSRVEIVERSRTTAGPGGRTLENLFHLMVVISIQTTQLLGFLGALQLTTDKAELRTVVCLNAQATIGPQLPLAAEPVRGLDQRDQAGCSNRADAGNLAQELRGLVFPALGQKLGSQVSPQGLRGKANQSGPKQTLLRSQQNAWLVQIHFVDEGSKVRKIKGAVYASRNVLGGEPKRLSVRHGVRVITPARSSSAAELRVT